MDITFVVGCARSGTSILGDLINQHARIMYVYEEPIWRKLAETDSHAVTVHDIPQKNRGKLRRWFKMYKRKNKIVVEKNPRHIVRVPFIKSIFPEAKIIHIVRDGRDVSCSLKTGLCGKTWAHVKPPNWREIEKNYEGVIRCAHAWKSVMEIASRDLDGYDHLQIKYEDLVNDPLATAEKVFEYLGVGMTEKVAKFSERIQNKMEGSYVSSNQRRWYTTDHSVRIGRWKENMTEDEQISVEEIIRHMLDHFGYK